MIRAVDNGTESMQLIQHLKESLELQNIFGKKSSSVNRRGRSDRERDYTMMTCQMIST